AWPRPRPRSRGRWRWRPASSSSRCTSGSCGSTRATRAARAWRSRARRGSRPTTRSWRAISTSWPGGMPARGTRWPPSVGRRAAGRAVTAALERAEPGQRRALLLRRYEYENELGDHDAAYRTLQAWLEAYAAAGSPSSETPVAEAAARRLAELDVERGDYESA